MHSPWISTWSPLAAPNRVIPIFSSGNMSLGRQPLPLCVVRDPDMCLRGSSKWDYIRAPGGRAGLSQQAASLHPQVSGSIYYHNVQATLLLFLSHLTTTYSNCGLATQLVGLWVVSSTHPWNGSKPACAVHCRAGPGWHSTHEQSTGLSVFLLPRCPAWN